MIKIIVTVEDVPQKGMLVSYDAEGKETATQKETAVGLVLWNAIHPVVLKEMAALREQKGGTLDMVQSNDTQEGNVRDLYRKRFREGGQ